MGKKSKRRSNVVQQKESLRARRERQLEVVDEDTDSPVVDTKWLCDFSPGDWVWYRTNIRGTEETYSRGIVVAVDKDLQAPQNEVRTIAPVTDDPSDVTRHSQLSSFMRHPSDWKMVMDVWPRALRFDVGDRVLCCCEVWVPATIKDIYPIDIFKNADSVAVYKCKRDHPLPGELPCVAVPHDNNDAIVKRPNSFRFSLGDEVIFASALALGLKTQLRTTPWIIARIVAVDVVHPGGYGVYEVTFSGLQRNQHCFIWRDNDQHIASVHATPRERFLDSIKQDCDYEHFQYLVSAFDLDVMPIQDQVIEMSFQFACYGALLWLLESGLDLEDMCHQNGKSDFNCHISQSLYNERYFRKVAYYSRDQGEQPPEKRIYLNRFGKGAASVYFQVLPLVKDLVHHGKTKLLSLLFCPVEGLACDVQQHDVSDEELLKLWNECRSGNKHNVANVLECFMRFRWFWIFSRKVLLHQHWDWDGKDIFLDHALVALESGPPIGHSKSALSTATEVLHFFDCWNGFHPKFDTNKLNTWGLKVFAENGWVESLHLFVLADSSILDRFSGPYILYDKTIDNGEYIQPELRVDSEEEDSDCYSSGLSLVEVAALSQLNLSSKILRNWELASTDFQYYLFLESYLASPNQVHLVDFLVGKQKGREENRMASYRIALLTDDQNLEKSQALLNFLVLEKKMGPPSALDVIQWRRCGILRWLVENDIVKLHSPANSYSPAVQETKSLLILGEQWVPGNLTLGDLLCFCAIEFDDLQSLLWLIEDQGIDLQSITLHGWNMAHACAFFGRSEIALSLYKLGLLDSKILAAACTRKPYHQALAVHIAVEKGFTFVAKILMKAGSPVNDNFGRNIMHYAKRSGLDFVLDYAQALQAPLILENNIQKLLSIFSDDCSPYQKTKKHLLQTDCMNFDKWQDAETWQDIGPLGKSFEEILDELGHSKDPDFIAWLCSQCANMKFRELHFMRCFDGSKGPAQLGKKDLEQFAAKTCNKKLSKWLNTEIPFFLKDQAILNPLFVKFQEEFYADQAIQQSLQNLRSKWLRQNIFAKLRRVKESRLQDFFLQGESVQEVQALGEEIQEIICEMLKEEEGMQVLVTERLCETSIIQNDGSVNPDLCLWSNVIDTKISRVKHSIMSLCFKPILSRKLYFVLAAEGHNELLQWLIFKANNFPWDKRCQTIRIAAFMGHDDIVWCFVHAEAQQHLRTDLFHAALFGLVEGGNLSLCDEVTKWAKALQISWPKDPMMQIVDSSETSFLDLVDSLLLTAVYGCLHASKEHSEIASEHLSVLKWMKASGCYPSVSFLQATAKILEYENERGVILYQRAAHLVCFLIEEVKAEWWQTKSLLEITQSMMRLPYSKPTEAHLLNAQKWLKYLVSIGQDLQTQLDRYGVDLAMFDIWSAARAQQLHLWSQFQALKDQQPLLIIQNSVESGSLKLTHRDKGGFLVSHLAAAYNRTDVLVWLIQEKGMSLYDMDFHGRNVLAVARASNATDTTLWIEQYQAGAKIASFVSSHIYGQAERQKLQFLVKAASTLQACYRGALIRSRYSQRLHKLKESSKWFQSYWASTLQECESISESKLAYETWESLKELQCDFTVQLDMAEIESQQVADRLEKLNVAAEDALEGILLDSKSSGDESECNDDADILKAIESFSSYETETPVQYFKRVKYTKNVEKWLRIQANNLKEIFVDRIKQLAAGERGRKLAKRLVGCESLIYETYLKSDLKGHRILWTPQENETILVWYVASHDNVKHCIKLIDDSESRSSRQLANADSLLNDGILEDLGCGSSLFRVQLEPKRNAPLKLFEVSLNEIDHVLDESWVPQLYLTEEERSIVQTSGTVLVLGRSGTGKTICISNRMDFDYHHFGKNLDFSQLFVARSQQLCNFVKRNVEESTVSSFVTFDQLLRTLLRTLTAIEGSPYQFFKSQMMNYQRFKREVHSPSDGIDGLIVWSNIRSFIKGSMEAQQQPDKILSESAYLELGKRRCRLPTEQRQVVYKIFQRYNLYLKENGLWDEMDRAATIAECLEQARQLLSPEFESLHRSKVYVDEVQDYTQVEIYIFFLLSGAGDLFLAGDPCQSVVEGVEFRFEEIRSVGFHICGRNRPDLIPNKPKTVNVNFRSHSGILDTAAAVLSCLFGAFPDSAKQLKEDHGLFVGPRPGVFHRISYECLQEALTAQGGEVVVLTHDEAARRCRDALGGYSLVYGIREAKGLEFKYVVLLDFFSELPQSLQKPWRDLLLGRTLDTGFSQSYPEIEGHLKLLYTAVTRAMDRLFFAETKPSAAGDAFVRWITTCTISNTNTVAGSAGQKRTRALATRSQIDDVGELMRQTPDDCRASGFDNAIMAEACDDLEAADGWVEKAIHCFQQANDIELASKARVYRSSLCFRSMLQQNEKVAALNPSEIESEAARLVKSLLIEHLVVEAVSVCHAALPYLPQYSKDKVRDLLIRRLRKDDDEFE